MFIQLRRWPTLLIALMLLLSVSVLLGPVLTQDSPLECPLGQGFWKNHPAEWPVTELTLGAQTYTQGELLAILFTPTQGDASLILAHQLIAVRLNMAAGVDAQVVDPSLAQADELLSGFEGKLPYTVAPSSDVGQAMVIAGSTFDAYNQGFLMADCTPEATPEATAPPEATPEMTPEATSEPDDDLTITIIIEGPVQKININIITIYNIDIIIDPADPILTVIQVGDFVRVGGNVGQGTGTTIVIIAVTVVIVDIDIFIGDSGQVWRDTGDCLNPPPPWAPAHGWRRRCDPGGGGNDSSGSGSGKGKSKDKKK